MCLFRNGRDVNVLEVHAMELDFTKDTLVLVAHGSGVNAGSSAAVRLQADALRRRGGFLQVLTGFKMEEPRLGEVLSLALGVRIFIVPFFVSEGFFTEEVVPQEMGLIENGVICRRQVRGGQTVLFQPSGNPSANDRGASGAGGGGCGTKSVSSCSQTVGDGLVHGGAWNQEQPELTSINRSSKGPDPCPRNLS